MGTDLDFAPRFGAEALGAACSWGRCKQGALDNDSVDRWLYVYSELDTFVDLTRRGEALARWVETAFDRVIRPLHRQFLDDDGGATVAGAAGAGATVRLGLERHPRHGTSTRRRRFSDGELRTLLSRLRDGEVGMFSLTLDVVDADGLVTGHGAGIDVDLEPFERSEAPATIIVSAPRWFFSTALQTYQRDLVEVITSAATTFEAATGYLTLDRDVAAYEQWVGRDEVTALIECRRWLRGYYWGNILSGEHIRALGGLERVLDDAPCAVKRDLTAGENHMVYLQLTEDLDHFDDDELRALRDFLAPVLPSGVAKGSYLGPRLRVVRD